MSSCVICVVIAIKIFSASVGLSGDNKVHNKFKNVQ